MSEVTMRRCDRGGCGALIEANARHQRVTLHAHHSTTIDLCGPCADALGKWLEPNRLVRVERGREVEPA